MTGAQPAPRSRRLVWLGAGAVVLIVLGLGGFFTASALEEHDSFCISCHTVPEVTYFNRAYISIDNPDLPVMDLATVHYHAYKVNNKGDFACINCHRGDASLGHRVATLALGGRDALIYITGQENPAIEKSNTKEGWLPNTACTTCHAETLLTLKGLDNHFHTHLPQAKHALASGGKFTVPESLKDREKSLLEIGLQTVNTTLVCTDCHQAHTAFASGATTFFMDTERRNIACVACHQAAKAGPQDVKNLK